MPQDKSRLVAREQEVADPRSAAVPRCAQGTNDVWAFNAAHGKRPTSLQLDPAVPAWRALRVSCFLLPASHDFKHTPYTSRDVIHSILGCGLWQR